MNRVAGDRAIARGIEAQAQAGRSCGADIEVRIAKGLIRQSIEGNRLIRLANVEALWNIGRRIEIRVARLCRRDCASTRAGYMNRVAGDRAIARSTKAHAQTGRSRGADIEISVAKRLVSQSIEGDRLIGLGNVEALRHVGGRI